VVFQGGRCRKAPPLFSCPEPARALSVFFTNLAVASLFLRKNGDIPQLAYLLRKSLELPAWAEF